MPVATAKAEKVSSSRSTVLAVNLSCMLRWAPTQQQMQKRQFDLSVMKLSVNVDLSFGDVTGQVRNRMRYIYDT